MDQHHPLMEQHEVHVDLVSVINANTEGLKASNPCSGDHFMSENDDHLVKLDVDPIIVNEKRKKGCSSAKKPPKPPRPQRGFSLDAADQKLIKELAELAIIKRARIERMKAIMQKKASKNSSQSSNGTLFAMIFTIIVFIVVLFQGMSCQISYRTIQDSHQTTQTIENGLISIQAEFSQSAHGSV